MSEKGKGAVAVQFADDVGREPSKSGGKITGERLFVVASILVTELCERLTYYSVVANMVLFCTSELNFSSDDASVVTLVFSGKQFLIIFQL
jgi:dipeptide/tripeptide permease